MVHWYFEDIEVGASRKAGPYLVSKNEIVQFAKQYDPVPRHIDEDAAAGSVFGGLSASSAHTFSIFILLTTKLQHRFHVLAGMGWDELSARPRHSSLPARSVGPTCQRKHKML